MSMEHLQNATLAGGVAVGACADLMLTPGGAVVVGALAGILSTCGFKFIQVRWLNVQYKDIIKFLFVAISTR